jgi:hypothetical protein
MQHAQQRYFSVSHITNGIDTIREMLIDQKIIGIPGSCLAASPPRIKRSSAAQNDSVLMRYIHTFPR